MEHKQSELTVITKAKDLCSYVMTESGKVIRKVKQQTKYKYKRKLKYFQRAYADGNIELEEINQVLSSYRAHLAYGHTYKLQKKILGDFVLRRNSNGD